MKITVFRDATLRTQQAHAQRSQILLKYTEIELTGLIQISTPKMLMVLDQYFLSLFCVQYVTHCIVLDNCFFFRSKKCTSKTPETFALTSKSILLTA